MNIDSKGYLLNYKKWDFNIANRIAVKESLILNTDHWKIIFFIRQFYCEYHIFPSLRIIIHNMKKKYSKKKFNSQYLFLLFPKGPLKQASKIAGLPRPNICL
ncbi:TusE/DsrC/DsvC family sulfur relay protein [Buchnera aphidicola]|uniref:Sulfurtransferase n=1 Tax=Buchnera aphidicola (Anoecia oenotherae) TaxID=1241833 RepID=A0A4D6XYB4_9GAMM|nr:TusE/DsrC/DsvC family sulfur relay protein [Buchnera aphidicola]QCI19474.1 TusE/DsrC/DsvC family sulfur relay protein [Buchnera aphidicola (Anoecia oenotherae)]